MFDHEDLKKQLLKHGCDIAANHLVQAKSALDRNEWESASAQMRSALEAAFDRVAKLKLSTPKRGGDARRALQGAGLLASDEAKAVQSFIDYCGKGGSHAGRSTESSAKARYQAGLGYLTLALGLLPELIRVENALSALKPRRPTSRYERLARLVERSRF